MKPIVIAVFLVWLSLPGATAKDATRPDVTLFDSVLREHVLDAGGVRYGDLRRNLTPLDTFVRQMSAVSPHSHPHLFASREAKLAYWINAYNGLVLWAFAQDYPEKKDRLSGHIGRLLFFYKRKFKVGAKKLSLADIENKVIRADFREPRIHFALVCASASCPPLVPQAYTEANLEELLDRETRRFLSQPRNVRLDPKRRVVTLSKLFDWYGQDFGSTSREILEFVASYRSADKQRLLQGNWKIRHFDYDWSVNDAPAARGTSE